MNKLLRSAATLQKTCRKTTSVSVTNRRYTKSASTGEETATVANASDEHYDIVIAGGGLVGGTCAVALGHSPVLANQKILMLEPSKSFFSSAPPSGPTENSSVPYSNRVYAISPGSKKFFDNLCLWEDVWRSQDVVALQVWDAISDAKLTISNPDYETVCHIVESPVLSYAVEKGLSRTENVTVKFGTSLEDFLVPKASLSNENAVLKLSDGKQISTKLLIGADGYNSRVRKIIQAPYLSGSYDRIAIVATLRLIENTDNNMAWQRFLPTGGPIAVLPLSSEYSSLVWSTTVDRGRHLMQLSDIEFIDEVNSALWKEYPRSEFIDMSLSFFRNIVPKESRMLPPSFSEVTQNSRATFPLGYGHSAFYVHRRVALIGDAAHRVHPLGGQGLNLGIGDVSALVSTIENSVRLGENIGSLERLKKYETSRQRHNVVVQSGLDALHRIYSFQFAPIVLARSLGLTAFDRIGSLKKLAMSQAAA